MSINSITDTVNSIGTAWEEFKQTNEKRLQQIERKGNADPLFMEKLNRISDTMDNYGSRFNSLETAIRRPDLDYGTKSFSHPENSEYKTAFTRYLRKGQDAGLEAFESKALSVGSDPDGGYLVTPTMSSQIAKAIYESSPLRQLARVESISSDSIELIDDHSEAAAGWTTETSSVNETTSPQVGKRSIAVHELYAQPKATQKLLDDAAIDVEAWLSSKVADIFARKEAEAFITGDGVGKPRGILSYTAGTDWGKIEQVNSGTSAVVSADKLVDLFYRLKEPYMRNATFLMNRVTIRDVRLLKAVSDGHYLWQPGLVSGTPDTLMGVPVAQAADMPIPAANSLSIAVGDFTQAYLVVDRIGLRTLRDPFTDKPFVKFYTTKRVGGDVVNFEAIKIMKLAS
jgi:HK97 family phage major capsid protein